MISRPFGETSNTFSSVKPSNFSRKRKYPLESFWLLKKILLLSVLWFSAASVNAPTIPLILDALLPSRAFDTYGPGEVEGRGGGGGGRARYPGFQVTRMIEGFSGFEIFDSGFFGVGNFCKYFLGWLDLSGDFWGYSN